MSKLLFHIKDIECSYQNSPRSVLEISELEIEKNSLVFFVGPSGVGKSTILETLGLMNNTIQSRPDSIFINLPFLQNAYRILVISTI